ncbi:zinc-dependent alcohol dehydrogenase [Roseomonas elaeocarpi]|uniref:Zinc-binding alcohol dehydrogenase n=1 Tax=Roseomonas elaeocarpi TaxID=907779 RepID=A0ABV6JT66_9PROT
MNAAGEARALWIVAPGRAELRREVLRQPDAEELLIRALHSGISRGTERLVLGGRVPESQYAAMRAPLMAGEFPHPVKYGYAAVGVVERGPAERIGQRVFVLHPHQDRFLAPAAMCVPVPGAVPDARAVLAANMETALNILWDAAPLPGERATVIGAGVVGLLVARLLARMPGIDLVVVDSDGGKQAIAEALGLRFRLPDDAPAERELIIHASASEAGLQLALRCAATEARILEASWFGDRAVSLPLGEAFHARRLRLISTQVGQVSPAMRGRRTYGERLALALQLLEDPALDVLCTVRVPFAKLPRRLPALLHGGDAVLCPVVDYGAD